MNIGNEEKSFTVDVQNEDSVEEEDLGESLGGQDKRLQQSRTESWLKQNQELFAQKINNLKNLNGMVKQVVEASSKEDIDNLIISFSNQITERWSPQQQSPEGRMIKVPSQTSFISNGNSSIIMLSSNDANGGTSNANNNDNGGNGTSLDNSGFHQLLTVKDKSFSPFRNSEMRKSTMKAKSDIQEYFAEIKKCLNSRYSERHVFFQSNEMDPPNNQKVGSLQLIKVQTSIGQTEVDTMEEGKQQQQEYTSPSPSKVKRLMKLEKELQKKNIEVAQKDLIKSENEQLTKQLKECKQKADALSAELENLQLREQLLLDKLHKSDVLGSAHYYILNSEEISNNQSHLTRPIPSELVWLHLRGSMLSLFSSLEDDAPFMIVHVNQIRQIGYSEQFNIIKITIFKEEQQPEILVTKFSNRQEFIKWDSALFITVYRDKLKLRNSTGNGGGNGGLLFTNPILPRLYSDDFMSEFPKTEYFQSLQEKIKMILECDQDLQLSISEKQNQADRSSYQIDSRNNFQSYTNSQSSIFNSCVTSPRQQSIDKKDQQQSQQQQQQQSQQQQTLQQLPAKVKDFPSLLQLQQQQSKEETLMKIKTMNLESIITNNRTSQNSPSPTTKQMSLIKAQALARQSCFNTLQGQQIQEQMTEARLQKALTVLKNGESFIKYAKWPTQPHERVVYLSADESMLCWKDPLVKKEKFIEIKKIGEIRIGRDGPSFKRFSKKNDFRKDQCSFVLVTSGQRFLELEASTTDVRSQFLENLSLVLKSQKVDFIIKSTPLIDALSKRQSMI